MLHEIDDLFRSARLNGPDHRKMSRKHVAARKPRAARRRRTERPAKGLFPRGITIYARYKGELYRAWLRRSGAIRLDHTTYDSPSAAGCAVRRGKATDGWLFWRVKHGDTLVPLKTFRK